MGAAARPTGQYWVDAEQLEGIRGWLCAPCNCRRVMRMVVCSLQLPKGKTAQVIITRHTSSWLSTRLGIRDERSRCDARLRRCGGLPCTRMRNSRAYTLALYETNLIKDEYTS